MTGRGEVLAALGGLAAFLAVAAAAVAVDLLGRAGRRARSAAARIRCRLDPACRGAARAT